MPLSLLLLLLPLHLSISLPPAYIHIGPYKTGSSYLQQIIHSTYSDPSAAHSNPSAAHSNPSTALPTYIHCPFTSPKEGLYTIPDLIDNTGRVSERMRAYREAHEGIIISAEALADQPIDNIHKLSHSLSGFNVTIIMYYREWSNQAVSMFNQEAKGVGQFFQDKNAYFSSWLYSHMNYRVLQKKIDFENTAQNYISVFGENHVVIVDYYGVLAAGRDLAYPILCDIVRGACSESHVTTETGTVSKTVNPSVSLVPRQMRRAFQLFALSHECTYDDYANGNRLLKHSWGSLERLLVTSDISMLAAYGLYLDQRIRDKFGKRMIYANRTANVRAASQMKPVQSVNIDAVFRDPKMIKEFHRILDELRRNGKCGHSS